MKIVHILTSLGAGGVESFVTQSALCQARDHNVYIILLRLPEQPSEKANEHMQLLKDAGIDVHTVQNTKAGAGALSIAFRLRRMLVEIAPDVVNAHSYRALFFRFLAGGRIFGNAAKWIYTHHTAPLLVQPLVFAGLNTCVARYIANSQLGAETLRAHTKKPVEVVYHGVIFEDPMPAAIRPEGPATFVITSVGSLRTEKRHDKIPKIAAALRESNPQLFAQSLFQIVGAGPCMADLRAQIAQLNLVNRVQLLGERSDVMALLLGSDVFLLTSDFEGVPISLIEAGKAGLPLVSADAGACREVFEDGREGYLVAIDNIEGYAQALQRIATQPDLSRAMRTKATGIPERFQMSDCLNQTNLIYESVQANHNEKGT